MGTRIIGTFRNIAPRQLRQTSFHPLDFAITGNGYFAIQLPNGRVGYTRAGVFQRDPESGNIITSDGNLLETAIAIPPGIVTENVRISESRLITTQDPNDTVQTIEIGQLEICKIT